MSKNLYINEFSPEPMEDETKMLEGSKYRTVGHPALARKGHRLQQKTLFRKRWFAILTTAVMMLIMAFGIVKLSSLPMGATAAPMVHEKVQSDVPSYQDGWTGGVDIDPVHVDSKIIDDQPMKFDELTVDNLGDLYSDQIKLRARRAGDKIWIDLSKERGIRIFEALLDIDNDSKRNIVREFFEQIRNRLNEGNSGNEPKSLMIYVSTNFFDDDKTNGRTVSNGYRISEKSSNEPARKVDGAVNEQLSVPGRLMVNKNSVKNEQASKNDNEMVIGFNKDYNIDVLSTDSNEVTWKEYLSVILDAKRRTEILGEKGVSSFKFRNGSKSVDVEKKYLLGLFVQNSEGLTDSFIRETPNDFLRITVDGKIYDLVPVKDPNNLVQSTKMSPYFIRPHIIFKDKWQDSGKTWMLIDYPGIPLASKSFFTDEERRVIISDLIKAMVLAEKNDYSIASVDPGQIFLKFDESTQTISGIKILDNGTFRKISQTHPSPVLGGGWSKFAYFLNFMGILVPKGGVNGKSYSIHFSTVEEDLWVPAHTSKEFVDFYLVATQRTANKAKHIEELLDHPFITGRPLSSNDSYGSRPSGTVIGKYLVYDGYDHKRSRIKNASKDTSSVNTSQKNPVSYRDGLNMRQNGDRLARPRGYTRAYLPVRGFTPF